MTIVDAPPRPSAPGFRAAPRFVAGVIAGLALAPAPSAQEWVSHQINGLAGEPSVVLTGDFDGDGRVDCLAPSDLFETSVAFQRDLSTGTWDEALISHGGHSSFKNFARGDVDADGDLDVIVTDLSASFVGWLENADGSGTSWTLNPIAGAESGPREVEAVDIDGDGDVDVVVGLPPLDEVVLYENTAGDGSAWTRQVLATADGPRELDIADMDADGDVDVIIGSDFDDLVRIIENPTIGGGTWQAHVIAFSNCVHEVSVGDVNADGLADIVSYSFCDDIVAWHQNPGTLNGNWLTITVEIDISFAGNSLIVDWDGDGDGDLITRAITTASPPQSATFLYENVDGLGRNLIRQDFLPASALTSMQEDVDGDGDPDVVITTGDGVYWVENRRDEPTRWSERTLVADDISNERVLRGAADVDGDGDRDLLLELVTAAGDVGLQLGRNPGQADADWTVVSVELPSASTLYENVTAADVDGDGDEDFVVQSDDQTAGLSSELEWFENVSGDGSSWARHSIATQLVDYEEVVPADVDGDGDTDLAFCGLSSGLGWWENRLTSGQSWQLVWSPGISSGIRLDMAALDLDLDGDVDLVTAGNPSDSTAATTWWENLGGSGTSWQPHDIAVVPGIEDLHAVDLDDDGDPDLTVIDGAPSVLLLENAAGDASTWSVDTLMKGADRTDVGATSLCSADLDDDGDLDLALALSLGNVAWIEQDPLSSGTWRRHPVVSTLTVASPELVPLDIDADGDVDLVTMSEAGVLGFGNPARCSVPASSTVRLDAQGANASGYSALAPVQGSVWSAVVDNTGSGNTIAQIVGFAAPLDLFVPTLGGSLLVDVTDPGGELLGLPAEGGTTFVGFSMTVPTDPALCGFEMATQAVGLGGGSVTLHNACDLVIGS